jgi:hypothetical protein
MSGEWIPISLFIGATVAVSLFLWFRFRIRREVQQTIRAAIERGQELTPEIIERLGHPPAPKNRELRHALIWLALAAGLALCGIAVPDPSGEALRGSLAGAAFPLCIGVAYLIMWRVAESS